MAEIKNLIFDLDGTLYPYSEEIEAAVDAKSLDIFCRCLNLGRAEAQKVIENLRRQYVYEACVVESKYGIPTYEYLEDICDVDVRMLGYNPKLAELLSALPQKKFIFTDSTQKHVRAVLAQIGVPADSFAQIVDGHQTQYRFKFSAQAFELFFALTGTRPEQSVIFEDSCRNIKTAKELGMMTILISADGRSCPEADYVFADINAALSSPELAFVFKS